MSERVYMSFGGGVQSTALAFLAAARDERLLKVTGGKVPELYLFADTGDERARTYAHVAKMREVIERGGARLEVLTQAQSLSEHVLTRARAGERGISLPPVYVETADGNSAPVRRGCTHTYKVKPLDRRAKEVYKAARKAGLAIEQWYGMSSDEVERLRDSPDVWRRYVYPLWEMGWTRWHCEQYLATQVYDDGSPVDCVRSSCVYCPFHSRAEWREVRRDEAAWAAAVAFDEALREGDPIAGLKSAAYVLRSRRPLVSATFEEEDTGQGELWPSGVGLEECGGVCGV
jgi:3'-phosphoadenosine 5'-phosphosulfate sulfotransferase (PAPS reductase)/FAD synthetase